MKIVQNQKEKLQIHQRSSETLSKLAIWHKKFSKKRRDTLAEKSTIFKIEHHMPDQEHLYFTDDEEEEKLRAEEKEKYSKLHK